MQGREIPTTGIRGGADSRAATVCVRVLTPVRTFNGCETIEGYTCTMVSAEEHVPCPGPFFMCSGEQCCPGFPDSNNFSCSLSLG